MVIIIYAANIKFKEEEIMKRFFKKASLVLVALYRWLDGQEGWVEIS
jgi:hypothetical protein